MKKTLLSIFVMSLAFAVSVYADNPYKHYTANLPFKMAEVKAPEFPERDVNLKDFGAVGDGKTLCTEAFAKAIDHLSVKGGGRLIVPRGIWHTGPIVLKSNINLLLRIEHKKPRPSGRSLINKNVGAMSRQSAINKANI